MPTPTRGALARARPRRPRPAASPCCALHFATWLVPPLASSQIGLFCWERFIDLYFVTDICLNFRSAWVDEESRVIFNQWEAIQRCVPLGARRTAGCPCVGRGGRPRGAVRQGAGGSGTGAAGLRALSASYPLRDPRPLSSSLTVRRAPHGSTGT